MAEYTRYIGAWMPQGWEWLIILLVALLIFGKRLPDLARSLGKSLTEFKKGISEAKEAGDEVKKEVDKAAKDATGLDDLHNKN